MTKHKHLYMLWGEGLQYCACGKSTGIAARRVEGSRTHRRVRWRHNGEYAYMQRLSKGKWRIMRNWQRND